MVCDILNNEDYRRSIGGQLGISLNNMCKSPMKRLIKYPRWEYVKKLCVSTLNSLASQPLHKAANSLVPTRLGYKKARLFIKLFSEVFSRGTLPLF